MSDEDRKRLLALRLAQARRRPTLIPSSPENLSTISAAEQQLCVLDFGGRARGAYNVSAALLLPETFDPAVIEGCFDFLAMRHPALASIYEFDGDEFSRRANPGLVLEYCHDDTPIELAQLRARLEQDAQQTLPLERGPLIRVATYRTVLDEQVLAVFAHHIVVDGASMLILVREFAQLVTADDPTLVSLPDHPVSYFDYAAWSTSNVQSLETDCDYWEQQLTGCSLDLSLSQRKRPPRTGPARNVPLGWDPSLRQGIEAIARTLNATPFTVLLALYQLMLREATGETAFVVGVPYANRPRDELANLVGFFANTLPMPVSFEAVTRFDQHVGRVRDTVVQSFEHGAVDLPALVRRIRAPRSDTANPIFQTMFTFHNAQLENLVIGSVAPRSLDGSADLTILGLEVRAPTAKLDLLLTVEESRDQYVGLLEYDSSLFDELEVAALADRLTKMAQAVVADPTADLEVILAK